MDYENMTFKVEFKNKELENLWIYLSNHYMFVGADAANAFMKCDEELDDIQDQCEHWKTMYANACGDQDVLKESIRLLDKQNRELQEENKSWDKRCDDLRKRHVDTLIVNNKTIDQLRKDNERLGQKVRDQEKEIIQRRKEVDCLYKELDRLRDENGSLSYQKIRDQEKEIGLLKMENKNRTDILKEKIKTIGQLREENEDLKKECKSLQGLNDDFLKKVIGKDDDIEKLDHMLQDLQREYDKLKNDRDRKAEAVVELAKKRDELQEEYNKLLNNSGYLRNSRESWRIRAEHAEAEVEKLKKKLVEANDILEETNRDRNDWRRQALMTKLTSKVPDIKEEYTMTVTMDNADYNDLMKLLWNKSFGASTEYMRDFLKAFCEDHDSCRVCPLKECGSDFGNDFDGMSDEEIKKYYKIAISKCAWHGDATAEKKINKPEE